MPSNAKTSISQTDLFSYMHKQLSGENRIILECPDKRVIPDVSDEQDGSIDFITRNCPLVLRSDGNREHFNVNRIATSLLRETSVPKDEIYPIIASVTKVLLQARVATVTAPFIREQVCNILYRRNPKWRFEYTRLGMPYFDFEKKYGDLFEGVDLENGDELDRLFSTMDRGELIDIAKGIVHDFAGVRKRIRENGAGSHE